MNKAQQGSSRAPVGHRGTPQHGRLARDEDEDLVLCHVCGRPFRSLGSHLRAHSMTAAEYREEFGLLRTRALSARSLSRSRSAAQRSAFASSTRMRADLTAGQTMARQGLLAEEARQSLRLRGASEELVRERRARLDDGRRTQALAAAARLDARMRELGFREIGQAAQRLYQEAELSLEETARTLGVGTERMRRLLNTLGVPIRATGENSATGRRARVDLNDRAAAEHVGTHDITAWLKARQAAGATLSELATQTNRSIPWVATRLRR
ncbi:MucR family transcriptional regulator [Kitasatospora sp. NPDC002040]|uniref:MucR family transcriptional regulator n=1 Tax=Kitasatospora sp. NPDC002040 TaxID=3154661 RepID=UPI003322C6DB